MKTSKGRCGFPSRYGISFIIIISHYYVEHTFAPTFPLSPSNPELPWKENHWQVLYQEILFY